ncbi:MAG: hypothetical protein VCC04_04175, partial [Myxococcota bacterium]
AWGLLVLLGVVWATTDSPFTLQILWLPLIIGLQFLLCLGLAFWVAYFGAIFADTQNIVAVGTRLLFFLSPIFYFARSRDGHPGIVPERYLDLYYLNPLAGLLDSYRDSILWGSTPTGANLYYVAGLAGGSLLLGFWLFSRGEGRFAKYLEPGG